MHPQFMNPRPATCRGDTAPTSDTPGDSGLQRPVLEALGIGSLATSVYLQVVQRTDTSVPDVALAIGCSESVVQSALEELAESGLVELRRGEGLVVVPPHRAIDALIARRELELATAAAGLQASREAVSTMLANFVDRNRHQVADGLDVLDGVEPVRSLLRGLSGTTNSSITNVMPKVPTIEAIDAARPADLVAVERGLAVRSVMPNALERNPESRAAVRRSCAAGIHVRLHPDPPLQVIIFDESVAVIPRDPAFVGAGAWAVRNPGLIQPIRLLVEAVWAQSIPLAATVEHEEEARVRHVFRMLAQGQKDETIARRLQTSVRTVRRLIAVGLDLLGAESRFEAGVLAQRQGWLTE